jgi:hypothetical protein
MKIVFFYTGLTDLELSGNQSFYNTILGYLNNGWTVHVFTMVPNSESLIPINSLTEKYPKLYFNRCPSILSKFLLAGKVIKNKFFLSKSNDSQFIDHHKKYNLFGKFSYVVFMYFTFLVDLIRSSFLILKLKPSVLYGVNSQGTFSASLLGRIFSIFIVTRFFGTIITPESFYPFVQS